MLFFLKFSKGSIMMPWSRLVSCGLHLRPVVLFVFLILFLFKFWHPDSHTNSGVIHDENNDIFVKFNSH